MRLLVVGGAGFVGSILRPALESAHHCTYLDIKPVPGAEDRTTVGSVTDEAAVALATKNIEGVIYLAMGVGPPGLHCDDIGPAFDVNVQGLYRVLTQSFAGGARTFVYTSTLSVYTEICKGRNVDEATPPNETRSYGLTKRLGEQVCQALAPAHPLATLVCLRLYQPRSDQQWNDPVNGAELRSWHTLGPDDLRALYLASLNLHNPGCHILQASGDLDGTRFPNHRATALLGWQPQGR